MPRSPRRQAAKVKLFAFCVAVLVFGALDAHARLGETESDLIQRFGQEQERPAFFPGARHLVFIKQGYVIEVGLIDGTSQLEIYSLYNQRSNTVLDGDKVKELLGIENQGHHWTPIATDDDNKWRRDDGAVAFFNSTNQTFSVETRTYIDQESAYSHPRRPSLDGF